MSEKKMSEAQKRALDKYKANVKRLTIDFPPSDAELWDHVQQQPNKQGYIKALIRADMGTKVYLIYKDIPDDGCEFIGRFVGTEEEVDRYCDEYNSKCRYEWEEITWLCVADMEDVNLERGGVDGNKQ